MRVTHELRKSGEEVLSLAQADSSAERVLGEADELFQSVASVEEIIEFIGTLRPRTVLTSWCTEIGRAAVPVLNERGVLTALVEDSWWHGGALDHLSGVDRPGLVCVGTEHCRQRVLAAWRGYPAEWVKVTGWPGFDEYSGYDVRRVSGKVRASLGLNGDWPIVFLSVDNNPGIGELCLDVVKALSKIDSPTYLVPGWHPGFDRSVPEERPAVEAALAKLKVGRIVDRREVLTSELVTAADVVVATYSSLLAVAAALRKQVIAVLYSETGLAQMQIEMGVLEFPLVTLGCAAKAGNRDELREILERALAGGLSLEEAQRQTFRLDGLNARRVAELIV